MTYFEHLPYLENIPAYALGALDAKEAAALEAHLQTCTSCSDELAAYRAVSDNLLLSLPPQMPSTALRKRLQKRLPSAQKTARPRLNWSFSRLAVAVAMVLLLALNVFSISQVRALRSQQEQLMDQIQNGQMALVMLSYPNTQSFPIKAAKVTGSLLLDKEYNNAVLILRGLPPISENQTYQIWLIDPNGDRTSAGLLRPQANLPFISQPLHSMKDLTNFVGVGMTVEPAGGSDHPTGSTVFRINF
ncbi:MAG TPA: anti-sigma factor [Anaerolineales bacterium]|nr:anti-sigma factor [Anaerolineales bacterium]